MKKAFILSALCALVLCSCSKDDEDLNTSFDRAEIHFKLAGTGYEGAPSSCILENFDFNVFGEDFSGNTVSLELKADTLERVIVCKDAPTAENSLFARLGFKASKKELTSIGTNTFNYTFKAFYVIYDKQGKEICKGTVYNDSGSGSGLTIDEIGNILDMDFYGEFELCYTQMWGSNEWNYNFGYKQLPN